VVFQSLGAGAEVEVGLPITIRVSNGQVPAGGMPSVVGLPLSEAYRTINNFIYTTGVWLDVYPQPVPVSDPAQANVVLGQNPAPGTAMSYKDAVYINVGQLPGAPPPPP
jgi:beta-lactam-binding protein with PASTA domain